MLPILVWRQEPLTPPGTTVDVLRAAGVEVVVWELAEPNHRAFDPAAWSGLVILGGGMNVDQVDRYPFLRDEVAWLRAALKDKLPILGICLGGQLLAKALGAKVTANAKPEIGWHTVELTAAGTQDPLLSDTPNPVQVCQWHGDTFELPVGSVLLATSPVCRHQAFRFGTNAWGLQFHPEVSAELLQTWINKHSQPGDCCRPDEDSTRQIISAIDQALPAVQILGKRILGRFAKLCKESAPEREKRFSQ